MAFDRAGSIPLILVEPGYQRRGIGTGLLQAALQRVRAGSAASVTAGSGGDAYIWPGVPHDLPAAMAFFASRGWQHSHDIGWTTRESFYRRAGYQPWRRYAMYSSPA